MAEAGEIGYTPAVNPLPMEDGSAGRGARFEELIDRGRTEIAAERLEDALATFEAAERLAAGRGDRTAADRAWLNRCAVLTAMQRVDEVGGPTLHRMRSILTNDRDPVNARLAAYNIAKVYELTRDYRKGLFYARIALDRSRTLGSDEWLASSHNQLGNLLLAESRFEEARQEYVKALELVPAGGDPVTRAAICDNLGYALAALGEHDRAFGYLYRSLRSLRRLGNRREQVFPHLRLCFTHLEVGRYRDAARHGVRALALAEEFGEPVSIQYALFLLGETAQLSGDPDAARRCFLRLQQSFFPDNPQLPDLLLSVDIRGLVNLKA